MSWRASPCWARRVVLGCVAGALGGCVTVNTINVSTKTSLERQLAGDLPGLSEEELLVASVRDGMPPQSLAGELEQRAVVARRRQIFNRDDILALKNQGCLGEGALAVLALRSCPEPDRPLAERMVQQENEDREAIITWVIDEDPQLGPANREEVALLYANILREDAATGHWIEAPDGTWRQK